MCSMELDSLVSELDSYLTSASEKRNRPTLSEDCLRDGCV
jgi:hypothetical protein